MKQTCRSCEYRSLGNTTQQPTAKLLKHKILSAEKQSKCLKVTTIISISANLIFDSSEVPSVSSESPASEFLKPVYETTKENESFKYIHTNICNSESPIPSAMLMLQCITKTHTEHTSSAVSGREENITGLQDLWCKNASVIDVSCCIMEMLVITLFLYSNSEVGATWWDILLFLDENNAASWRHSGDSSSMQPRTWGEFRTENVGIPLISKACAVDALNAQLHIGWRSEPWLSSANGAGTASMEAHLV